MAWLQAGITENLLSCLRSKCLQTFAKSFFICSVSLWAGFFSARLSVVALFWHIWRKWLWQPILWFRRLWLQHQGDLAHGRPVGLCDRGQAGTTMVRKGSTLWADTNTSLKSKENTVFQEQIMFFHPSFMLYILMYVYTYCYYNGLCFWRLYKPVFNICLRSQARGIFMIKSYWVEVSKCNKNTSHVGTIGSLHKEPRWT